MSEFDNSTMEEWNFLPQRHKEHIEEGMEEFDNSTIRQWKNGRMEFFTTETQRTHRRRNGRI